MKGEEVNSYKWCFEKSIFEINYCIWTFKNIIICDLGKGVNNSSGTKAKAAKVGRQLIGMELRGPINRLDNLQLKTNKPPSRKQTL